MKFELNRQQLGLVLCALQCLAQVAEQCDGDLPDDLQSILDEHDEPEAENTAGLGGSEGSIGDLCSDLAAELQTVAIREMCGGTR